MVETEQLGESRISVRHSDKSCRHLVLKFEIVIDKNFLGEDDFKFLSDDRNFASIKLFIFKYSKFIVGEDIRSVDVDENGVVVRLYNNYVNVDVK